MKFRFCGDGDCPDWLLMQINTLSSLEPEAFGEICELIVKHLQGEELDFRQLSGMGSHREHTSFAELSINVLSSSGFEYGLLMSTGDMNRRRKEDQYGRLKERRKEANLDMSAIKACTATIAFVFRSGISYSVPSRELGAELEQLGLEPHLSETLVKVYSGNFANLRKSALDGMLSLPRPVQISAMRMSGQVRLDLTLNGSNASEPKKLVVNLTPDQAAILLQELKSVAARIDGLMGNVID